MIIEDFNLLKKYDQIHIAKNTRDTTIIEMAIKYGDHFVKLSVAKNPITPNEILRDLLNENWIVLLAIADNPNTDPELMYDVFERMMELEGKCEMTDSIYLKLNESFKALASLRY